MATVLDSIKHYQTIIDNCPQDERKVLKCINKLFNLNVTVQHLQETGVGRTINALRKAPGDVGPAARSLVQKWKEMVAAEESEEEGYQSHETSTYNGHGSGRESDDNGRHDSRSNTNTTSKMNGHHSGTKREYRSSEDEESNVKRSKYDYDDYNKNVSNKIKQEETGRIKREDSAKIKHEAPDSDSQESDSGESISSDSSVEHRKSKIPDTKESSSNHKSSKHSSHNDYNSHKKESSSLKTPHQTKDKSHHTEKQPEYHSSKSKERYSSDRLEIKEKSHSSHKHKSSNDKNVIPDKKQKSEHKSSESKVSSKESKSSSKHSKLDDHRSHKQETSEKHKSSSDKHSSKSDKHSSSSSSRMQSNEKERRKHSDVEEIKHKAKDSSSSSSKEKHRSSSKEKPKDKSSSKEKSSVNSSEKHASSDSKSSSEYKSKSERHDSSSSSSTKKSKHRSSSSSEHKNEKSSSKTQEEVPKKKDQGNSEDSEDGIDCGSGASFAEALGMISPVKAKKKQGYSKDIQSPNSSFSNDLSPAALLAPTAKLAPLPAIEITSLPEISPNYRPRPQPKALPHFTDEDALNAGISSKNQRTKVYSGNKVMGKIPSLYEMCVHILQEHIDALEFTGGVPYTILKPVVDRATPQQLFTLEHYNAYLMEDTDHLWKQFCQKSFRNKQRNEMETWREMYLRCQEEQEHKLKSLTANIKIAQEAKKAPIKQTKMAYVDTVVKPPRNIARKQALHGTAHASTASPAARVAALASAPNVARAGSVRPPPPTLTSSAAHKPKKAPLMQKALQFMRGRKR